MLVIPAAIILMSLAAADWGRLGDEGAGYALALAGATLLVGFNEEIIFRGVLLHGFRQTGSEVHAWAWSTGLFALIHSANLFLGSPISSVVPQLFSTFIIGTLCYITRRATGGILVPILIHALYDFAVFSHGSGKGDVVPGGDTATLQPASLVPVIVLVLFVVVMIAHKQWMHPEQEVAAAG